jgi:hypothetical protein
MFFVPIATFCKKDATLIVSPTVSSATEKTLFVVKRMSSEATKIFSTSEKMLSAFERSFH